MPLQQTQVIAVLKILFVPNEKKLLLSLASLNEVTVKGDKVYISLMVPKLSDETLSALKALIEKKIKDLGAKDVHVEFIFKRAQNIDYIIAIGSGKGGVGKSTVATNLAVALVNEGKNVGLLDADIYGPNIPLMFGINELPKVNEEHRIIPIEKYGVKIMSLGFLLESSSTPVIWRGPLVTKALEQFYNDVEWGDLDFLLIDLPPGTGDVSLTIAQSLPTKYGIIVTTPQDLSVLDASKALSMFKKMNIEVVGVVENMSYFICPKSGETVDIFGKGGGEKLASKFNVSLLGKVPMEIQVREGGDNGLPAVLLNKNSKTKEIFEEIARNVLQFLEVK
jgi:ATP-binding protein involved in chromosome partitioning